MQLYLLLKQSKNRLHNLLVGKTLTKIQMEKLLMLLFVFLRLHIRSKQLQKHLQRFAQNSTQATKMTTPLKP